MVEALVIAAALDVVQEGLVQGVASLGLQLIVNAIEAVRLFMIAGPLLVLGKGADRGAARLSGLLLSQELVNCLSSFILITSFLHRRLARNLLLRHVEASSNSPTDPVGTRDIASVCAIRHLRNLVLRSHLLLGDGGPLGNGAGLVPTRGLRLDGVVRGDVAVSYRDLLLHLAAHDFAQAVLVGILTGLALVVG